MTVREATRDPGEVCQRRGRERALAVHGEDRRAIEALRSQAVDERAVAPGVEVAGVRLHPRRVVDDHVVDLGEELGDSRAACRCEQREPLGAQRAEGAQCGRRHQHVAGRVEAHREDPPQAGPRRDARRARRHDELGGGRVGHRTATGSAVRARRMMPVVDRSSTSGRIWTVPPRRSTRSASGSDRRS